MPLTRISIEQIQSDRWLAEVEAGGASSARREQFSERDFDALMRRVTETHDRLTGRHREAAGRRIAEVEAGGGAPLAEAPLSFEAIRVDERAELIAEADRLGVKVDRRWRDERLRTEIAATVARDDAAP